MNIVKVFKTFSYLNVFILPTWIFTPLLATETTIFFLIYEGNYSNLFDLTPGSGNGPVSYTHLTLPTTESV